MARKQPARDNPAGTLSSASRGEQGRDEFSKPLDERPIIKHFQSFLRDNEGKCRTAWDSAEENQRFAAGGEGQWEASAWSARNASGRLAFTLDDCTLATRAISGRELTARFEPSFQGRSGDDGSRVAVYREAVRYLRQKAGADNVESHAFRDLSIDNYSVVEWGQRWDGADPHGRTVVEHNPIWEHVWDTRARETCLVDRARDARGYFTSVDDFLMLFPGERDKIQEYLSAKKVWVSQATQTKYRHPWSGYVQAGQFVKRDELEIFLVNYQWKQREGAYIATVPPGFTPHPVGAAAWAPVLQALGVTAGQVADPELWPQIQPLVEQLAAAGQIDPRVAQLARPRMMKMHEQEFAAFAEAFAKATGRKPDAMTPEDGVFQWGIHEAQIVGDKVVKERRLPYRSFPRIYLTSVPISQLSGTKFSSVVDNMKDPQRFKNLVVTMAASHLQRMQKMGLLYHANAFDDPQALESELAKPFWKLAVKNGIPFSEAMEMVDGAGFPQGLDRFLDLADQATWRPTGMNPNTLGSLQDPRRVSPNVFQALADAVMTVLSIEFNSLQTMRRLSGDLLLDFQKEYYDPDWMADVVGPDKRQFIPGPEEWSYSFEYDAICAEVPVSKSEKEAAWDSLGPTGSVEKWVTAGVAPAWLIPELMPDTWLPEEKRKAWLAWLDQKGMGPNSPAQPPAPEGGGDPNNQGGAPAEAPAGGG